METITCETCHNVIATGESRADAVENAFVDDMDASCHEESGDWECGKCMNARMAEAMADYYRNRRVYEAAALARQQAADIDDFLGRADLRRDIERGK